MKTNKLITLLVAAAISVFATLPLVAAPFGSAFTYQGRLNFGGAPVADGLYDFRFQLHDAATAGSSIGGLLSVSAVPVTNGLFTAQLDFGFPAFTTGEPRWLQLQVNTNGATPLAALAPRQHLAPTPQAFYARNAALANAVSAGAITGPSLAPGSVGSAAIADGGIAPADLSPALLNDTFWKLTGNAGTDPGVNFLGTTDNQPLVFKANSGTALYLQPSSSGEPSVIGGSSHDVSLDVAGVTIAGGAQNVVGTNATGAVIGGGARNTILAAADTYFGGTTPTSYSSIGGGVRNYNQGVYATIAGGIFNIISTNAGDSFIGGGYQNRILSDSFFSSVVGGWGNVIQTNALTSVIGGGKDNIIGASSQHSVIAGGLQNRIQTNSVNSMIGGGFLNLVGPADCAAVVSGCSNQIVNATNSAILGGTRNNILNNSFNSVILGGSANRVTTNSFGAVVGGGSNNVINLGRYSGLLGGQDNRLNDAYYSAIVGGAGNAVTSVADYSAVGGGQSNTVRGTFATVPGGRGNQANADSTFAAGNRAVANHKGSFVWADSTEADFTTTTTNQFAVRANNGVTIQSTNTAMDLRGGGALRVAGAGIGASTPVFIHRATAANIANNYTRIDHPHCNGNPNAILIVTQNYNPGNGIGTYNNSAIGVFYDGFTSRWAIFNENTGAPMPVNAAFNVMIFKP